jgi:hypothetical protein
LSTTYEHGLALRNGALFGGYAWNVIPGRLVFEPALELGLGRPTARALGGVGAYTGAAAQLRMPVFGPDEAEPAFNVYAISGDVVLTARAGGWMPPEAASDKQLVWEWTVELGLRLSFSSDVATHAQGELADTESTADGGTP